jgi:hypothetical protein
MRAMCRGHAASAWPLPALRDSPAGGAAEGGAFDSREKEVNRRSFLTGSMAAPVAAVTAVLVPTPQAETVNMAIRVNAAGASAGMQEVLAKVVDEVRMKVRDDLQRRGF